MMTLDDLAKLYYAGWFKIANKRGGAKDEAERAGIRAVVEALRDEISRMEQLVGVVMSNAHVSGSGILDEILGDAGEKAAGSSGVGSNPTLAADFCEVQPLDSTRHLRGCSKYPTYDPIRPFCGNCGKPIKVPA